MNWLPIETLFIEFRLANWGKGWTWEYSESYELLLEKIYYAYTAEGLTVDDCCDRFVQLGQHIERVAHGHHAVAS